MCVICACICVCVCVRCACICVCLCVCVCVCDVPVSLCVICACICVWVCPTSVCVCTCVPVHMSMYVAARVDVSTAVSRLQLGSLQRPGRQSLTQGPPCRLPWAGLWVGWP